MIDKNGKLFGKINLVDLIIVLIIVLLAAFAVFKFAVPSNDDVKASQFKLTLKCEETPDYVLNYINKGDPVYDSQENITIGTVESFEVGDPVGYEPRGNGDGEILYHISRDGYSSVTLLVNASGIDDVNGAKIDGVLYGVGHTMTVYAGQAKLYLRVKDLEFIQALS